MKNRSYTFGVFLIFVGILFLLLNLNIITLEWLLLILSIGILVGYLVKKSTGYLLFGSMLLGISLILILDKHLFVGIDIESFLLLTILGIVSLIIYGKEKNRSLLTIGMLSISFGLYNLLRELTLRDVKWALYLLLGISFYIIYLIGYRNSNSKWAKHLGSAMVIISLIFLISSQDMLKLQIWRFIFYLLPVLLIGAGVKIIYDRVKTRE